MTIDLGELKTLAKAIGLLDRDGEPVADWFSQPGRYLSAVLADDDQRAALLAFAADVLGDSATTADASGRTWLPVARVADTFTLAAVVAEPDAEVHIGAGVRLDARAANGAGCAVEAFVPLFATARSTQPAVDAVLLGTDRAAIEVELAVTLPPGTEAGGVALSGATLGASLTTGPHPESAFRLALTGLRLPGAAAPTDVVVDGTSATELDEMVLNLVLGLLRAQASTVAGGLHGLAVMLGLAGGGVPEFPLADVLARGPVALADWFAATVSDALDGWLGGLAELIGAPPPSGGELSTTIEGATLGVSLSVVPGPAARPVVTPHLSLSIAGASAVRLALDADPVTIDLATGSVRALPRLAVTAEIRPDTGRLLEPVTAAGLTVAVRALRAGLALDESRRPVLVLAAYDAIVGSSTFNVLDLTSPEALTAMKEEVVADAAAALLGKLGTAGDAAAVLLGLADPPTPPGAPSLPKIDIPGLLANPLNALAAHWQTLLTAHADRVPDVLAVLFGPVTGTGDPAAPWRLPLADSVAILVDRDAAIGIEGRVTLADIADSGVSVAFLARATILDLDLSAMTAAFLPQSSASLMLTEAGGGRMVIGGGEAAVSTDAVGLGLTWSSTGGLAIAPSAGDVRLRFPSAELPIPVGVPAAEEWAAAETLLGTVAKRLAAVTGASWIGDIAVLLGWMQPVDGSAVGAHLALADLITDPEQALRAYAAQVLTVSAQSTALAALRDFLRSLLGGLLSGLNPPPGQVTTLTGPPFGWLPGDEGLPPEILIGALASESTIDTELADLIAGRGDIVTGLTELTERWAGTDSIVALPDGVLPAGVTAYRAADLPHTTRLDLLPLADITGAVPDTVVYVAIDAPGSVDVLPAGQAIDLTGAGLPAEAFTPPTAQTGVWAVRLAGRADVGGPDPVASQAKRLRRVLEPLAGLPGGILVVAHGGAGHAAIPAAAGLDGVTAVVTVGTPWSPVSVDVLDRLPAGEALRLLDALLAEVGASAPDEPDDPDLGLGRGLVGGLMAIEPLDDPLRELRPPATPPDTGGLAVHAVVGSAAPESIQRAVTAIVAAVLSARARARAESGAIPPEPAEPGAPVPVTLPRVGTRAPVLPAAARDGLLTRADLDLYVGPDGPALAVAVELSSAAGWLVGGPDPGRSPGVARPLALRRLTATVSIPLAGTGTARTTLTLHDLLAFGVRQARVELTTVPPEVRAVLGQVASRITGKVRDALVALGVLGPDALGSGTGLDATTLERWLLDPRATAQAMLADSARRSDLAVALRALGGDTSSTGDAIHLIVAATSTRPAAVLDLDLAARSVSLSASGTAPVPWNLTVNRAAGGSLALSGRLGPPAVELLVDAPALSVRLRTPGLGSAAPDTVIWPTPDPAAVGAALLRVLPGTLVYLLLDALRTSLAGLSPGALTVLDALLDALGLLAPAAEPGEPATTRLPARLMADPAGYLESVGDPATLVPALLDAVRGLLGGGTAGQLDVATGVSVHARAAGGGTLNLGIDVDGSALSLPGRLVPAGTVDLVLGSGRPLPSVLLTLGVDGIGKARLTAGPSGIALALVPGSGGEIPILPAGPGLGGLAAAAGALAVRALPPLLDAVAGLDPAGQPATAQEIAGRLVARLGDALALRTSTGFDGDALAAFGASPAAALAARSLNLAAAGLGLVAEAVGPLLGGTTRAVTVSAGSLTVTVGPVVLAWRPGTNRADVTVTASGVPGVEHVSVSAGVDLTGLVSLDALVGPAELAAGGVTLRPYARVRAGTAARSAELGLKVGTDRLFAARWTIGPPTAFGLLAIDAAAESSDPADVALAAVAALVDLAGSVVLAVPAVRDALELQVLGTQVRDLLAGVVLDGTDPTRLAAGLVDPDLLPRRFADLIGNLANAPDAAVVIADALELGAHADGDRYGVTVGLRKPYPLGGEDVTFTLEADASWILAAGVPAGLSVDVLTVESGTVRFTPRVTVGGLGLRMGRASGPLLDAGVTIDSVAVHLYAGLSAQPPFDGGVQLEVAGLAVPLAGASGGDNPVASGLLASGGTADKAPRPAFSPALAVQRTGTSRTTVTLRAGPGAGPWWLVIQRSFGPVYLEQVGFEVTVEQDRLGSFGVLLDGKVSLLGLSAAVDDLAITYLVSAGSALEASAWKADLAGFTVTADVSGIVLAGGLRKFPVQQGGVEYLGMLMARFGAYGLAVYGGYGLAGTELDRYAAIFLFGAVNGPIGGPPAFFVTGIGGGFGINRALIYPADLSAFGAFPLIKALNPAGRPGDPMAELVQVRDFFPAQRGTFWFAAGLSFTSFALIDGIAVIAVQVGKGLELSLLGLARMVLPRPETALVSVELGLLARFSSSEGELLVQAQLTDNSWLLDPSVKLTGGFAFATWFSGPNRGQAVVTLGGYHPMFRRDGYPTVPRLSIQWRASDSISISGESYFALTSEAIMAGVRIDAACDFGPAWAHLTLGADGIVFFDPSYLSVTVYAAISAGVTIDVWIGEISISVSTSARVTVDGPPFHGRASFPVGPVDLTVEFGDRPTARPALSWAEFVAKYLEEAASGVAHVLTLVAGAGAVPPAGSPATGGGQSPDGSESRPFRVQAEFELTVTSTVPVRSLNYAACRVDLPTVPEIAVAPMRATATPAVTLRITGPRGHTDDADHIDRLKVQPQQLGAYAIGTFGPAQDAGNPKVPSGDVIAAVDRIVLRGTATVATSPDGAPAIKYRQVETGLRRINPFVVEGSPARRQHLEQAAQELAGLVPPVPANESPLAIAAGLLARRAGRSPADVQAWEGERAAVPILGSLAEGLGGAPVPVEVRSVTPEPPRAPAPPRPPAAGALLSAPARIAPTPASGDAALPALQAAATSVGSALLERLTKQYGSVPAKTVAPRLSTVDAWLDGAVPARLLRVAAPAEDRDGTVLGTGEPAQTRTGRGGSETVLTRGGDAQSAVRLASLSQALLDGGAELTDGDVAVFRRPGADRDVDPSHRPALGVSAGRIRVVLLGPGGRVVADSVLSGGAELAVPPGVRTMACVAGPADGTAVSGWRADVPAPYLGDEVWLGAGCAAHSASRIPPRGLAAAAAGWIAPDLLVAGDTAVSTTFAQPATLVAIELCGGRADVDDVALGLDGASRAVAADGREAPPVVVTDGPRTVLVYRVVPEPERRLEVTVVTAASRRLTGVAALSGPALTADGIARAVAATGFPALVPPPAADGLGISRVYWKEP